MPAVQLNTAEIAQLRGEAPLRVAFQGELGAFSEAAVYQFFGTAEPVPKPEFAEVGRAVVDGDVEYGLLPIENTLAGSVVASYDVLAASPLSVAGEVITPIHHCVLGVPGGTLEQLTSIRSHPVALAQCTRFLQSRHGVRAVAVYDTAGAAKDVAACGDPAVGAIAGRHAATRYGLQILAADVEDRSDNQTRFLVVQRDDARRAQLVAGGSGHAGPMRTTLLVETPNEPGALVRVLTPFADRGVNLSKLESRPTGEPWTYRFFIELDADLASADATAALRAVRETGASVRSLGSYPRWCER